MYRVFWGRASALDYRLSVAHDTGRTSY